MPGNGVYASIQSATGAYKTGHGLEGGSRNSCRRNTQCRGHGQGWPGEASSVGDKHVWLLLHRDWWKCAVLVNVKKKKKNMCFCTESCFILNSCLFTGLPVAQLWLVTLIGSLRVKAEQGLVFCFEIMVKNNNTAGVVFPIGMGPTSQCSGLGAA